MQLFLLLGHEFPDRSLQVGPQDADLDQEEDAGLKQLLVESKNHENLLNVHLNDGLPNQCCPEKCPEKGMRKCPHVM